MGSSANVVGALVGGLAAIAFLALYVYSIVWAYGDAESRGKSGCFVALIVALLQWPVGLILWLVFRPNSR